MAGAILSSIIKWTTDKMSSLSKSSSSSSYWAELEIHKLRSIMMHIQATLDNAEERDIKENSEKLRLSELKEVAYDAEDLVGEYEYEILQCVVKCRRQMGTNSLKRKHTEIYDSANSISISIPDGLACRVKEITEKFYEITREWGRLCLPEKCGKRRCVRSWKPAETSGFLSDESCVLGRESEKLKLIELLLSEDNSDGKLLSVVPIVGMGGIGKTTLAQIVYNDPRVCQHFNLRGWVSMSENMDVVSLTKNVTMSFFGKVANHMELNKLHQNLKVELKGKRFLLVLDDVWNDKLSLWESLRTSLLGAEVGIVIVTTRDKSIANIMQESVPIHLSGLSFANSWLLFKKLALECKDPNVCGDLEKIGRKIVAKCKGLPLAIKALGGALRYESDEETWFDILESELWELDNDNEYDILPALKLSYDRMPTHLRRSFMCLSLFPKGFVLHEERIVALWMSHDLLQPQEMKLEMEIGKEYLNELLGRSILQYHRNNPYAFAMHDLLHDLAQSIAGHQYLQIRVAKLPTVPKDIRHLSLLVNDSKIKTINLKPLYELKLLRTLLILSCTRYIYKVNVENLDGLFRNLKYLRALELGYTDIQELPESIHNLKQLRYLCIENTNIENFPDSLCCLYNLQSLHAEIGSIQELPRDIGHLINLRHLRLDAVTRICMPRAIGELTNLQRLPIFYVGKGSWHCGLKELKELVSIGGQLHIYGLEHVVYSDVSSQEAYLKNKVCLESLMIEWDIGDWDIFGREEECSHQSAPCDRYADTNNKWYDQENQLADVQCVADKGVLPLITDEELAERVLESLQPHTNLKELQIRNFCGARFPSWVSDPSFSKLTSLTLYECRKCKLLPPLGQLPSLVSLVMNRIRSVQSIGREFCALELASKGFRSLESLTFLSMTEWVEWHETLDADFLCLRQLDILECPKLKTIPQCLTSVIKLNIRHCDGLLVLPSLPLLTNLELKYCNRLNELPSLPSLTSLHLRGKWNCVLSSSHMPILQTGEVCGSSGTSFLLNCHGLPLLQKLVFEDCSELRSIVGLCNFSCLKILEFSRCRKLEFSADESLPPMLQNVHIRFSPEAVKGFQKHIPHMREVTPYCFSASIIPSNEFSSLKSQHSR